MIYVTDCSMDKKGLSQEMSLNLIGNIAPQK